MTQSNKAEISFSVAQNQYYAAIVSIVFVAGATSSMLLGISLGGLLILFYALFIPVGITLYSKGLVIRRWIRKTHVHKSEFTLYLSGEKDQRVLQVTLPTKRRFRQIQVIVENEVALLDWLEHHDFEIGMSK